MSTVTFDTVVARKALRAAGFDEGQTETIFKVLADAQAELVTRDHLDRILAPIRTDLAVLKWGVGLNTAMVIAIFVKQFLP